MNKEAERVNVLTEGNGKNLVHAVMNAVTKGYADNIIIDDVLDLIRTNEVSKGVLATCPETLRLYAKSISDSLINIAQEIENFEIKEQELMVKRRVQNQDEMKEKTNYTFDELQDKEESKEKIEENEEKEDEEEVVEKEEIKKVVSSSTNDIKIDEDWDKSVCEENKLAGTLLINFNQDMSIYKNGSAINLKKSALDYLKSKVFFYFKKEYPQIKIALNDDIFKGNIKFTDVKAGKAQLEYEILNAF